MNKYKNKKIYWKNVVFDSQKEFERYIYLLQLQSQGKIENLQRQVTFELVPAQHETFERYGKSGKRLKDGKRCIEKAVTYKADFVYSKDGKTIVEDVKGFKTKEYIIKRKLMLFVNNIKILEV